MAFRLNMTMADGTTETLVQTEHDTKSKMGGIPSISTCCLLNPACIARMMNGEAVCSHCFSAALQRIRTGLKLTTSQNYYILNKQRIKDAPQIHWTAKAIKLNPDKLVRIESFGDVASTLQAINYLLIVIANPDCKFAAWTKNLRYWVEAFKLMGKPENLTLVFSSLNINRADFIPDWARPYVDHRFTVYTAEWLEAHGIKSNCAGISCAGCQKCYHRGTAFDIIEILR